MKQPTLKRLLLSLVTAVLMVLLCASGLLRSLDRNLSDKIYNSPKAADGLITVLGIDQYALEELGPWPWTRDVMAQVVRQLNADPDHRPVVIALDVLYTGTTQPAYDDALAAACREGGNVVVAEAASFKSGLEMADGDVRMNRFIVSGYDAAFPALREVAHPGHVNAMPDTDGTVRHALLQINAPGYGKVLSLAGQIYTDYCEATGRPVRLPKTDANGFYYLPYSVRPGGFSDGISVADVLLGDVPGSRFDGQIVFIGPYAAGLQDQYFTSIEYSAPMYGVEIQANALLAMIREEHYYEVYDFPQLVAVFLLTFLGAWIFLCGRPLPATLSLLGISGGWVGLCFLLMEAGLILHPLWVPVALAAAYLIAMTDSYLRISRERKRISDTFSRYVDPAIIGELMKQGSDSLALGGKLCDVAVLFVDIRGFTTMSEQLSPQEIVSILNRYLTLTTDCVMRRNGTLDKYVGDCTMAIWNAPLTQPDYIMNACRAALDMVAGCEALNRELAQTHGRTVAFGIGVHCGQAVVGNIGSPMRMDFTAIGDTVNTAARLEAAAPGGTVYVSPAVRDALGDRIRTVSAGDPLHLKGKRESMEVFRLEGLAESEAD